MFDFYRFQIERNQRFPLFIIIRFATFQQRFANIRQLFPFSCSVIAVIATFLPLLQQARQCLVFIFPIQCQPFHCAFISCINCILNCHPSIFWVGKMPVDEIVLFLRCSISFENLKLLFCQFSSFIFCRNGLPILQPFFYLFSIFRQSTQSIQHRRKWIFNIYKIYLQHF